MVVFSLGRVSAMNVLTVEQDRLKAGTEVTSGEHFSTHRLSAQAQQSIDDLPAMAIQCS